MRSGEHACISVAPGKGRGRAGRFILSLRLTNNRWRSFAFLEENNAMSFFILFKAENKPQVLDRIRSVIAEIAQDPEKARLLYDDIHHNLR
jgi:hypothetical protein